MIKPQKTTIVLFLFFMILVIAGCSTEKEPATINVIFTSYITNSPFFIAYEEGFFDEQGLTIEFSGITRGAQAIPALEQGDVDVVGGMVATGFFNAITRGANIKYVADKGHLSAGGCASSGFVASNAFIESNSAENPGDIKGAKISANPAAFAGYWVDTVLKQANLTLDDVDNLNLGNVEEFETIQEGTVDLISSDEPWISRIVQGGYGEVWVNYGDMLPGVTYATVWFGPNILEENPDIGNRFMVAYLKGVAQFNQGKTDRNVEILAKHLELDEQLLRDACWVSINSDGTIDTNGILDFQKWGVEGGLIDEIVPIEKFWDASFIDYAIKELK